jgi:hypothetical protein
MRRVTGSPVVSLLAVLAMVFGLALIAVEAWTRPFADAAAAAHSGKTEVALERYGAMEGRFESVAVAKQILPTLYQASIANQLQLDYIKKDFDKVIEKAALSPSTPAIHFWAGCALFEKARPDQKREDRVTWLNRAEDEFKKSLEGNPDDWDTKYNFELTRHMLNELRPDRLPPPDKIVPLLRPQPVNKEPEKRVG